MTTNKLARDVDAPLVHQFVRVFGRRPSAQDLQRYQSVRAGLALQAPPRLRVRAARIVTRL
jgi:hypothetical protein